MIPWEAAAVYFVGALIYAVRLAPSRGTGLAVIFWPLVGLSMMMIMVAYATQTMLERK